MTDNDSLDPTVDQPNQISGHENSHSEEIQDNSIDHGESQPIGTDVEELSPELIHDPYGAEVLSVSDDEFQALLNLQADLIGDFKEGEVVNAKVIKVTQNVVIMDFGFKSEGAVPLDEFKDVDALQPGETVEVLLESLEDDEGVVILS